MTKHKRMSKMDYAVAGMIGGLLLPDIFSWAYKDYYDRITEGFTWNEKKGVWQKITYETH